MPIAVYYEKDGKKQIEEFSYMEEADIRMKELEAEGYEPSWDEIKYFRGQSRDS